jgi:hypothetical protein
VICVVLGKIVSLRSTPPDQLGPPTLIADTESLRQQLRELHASIMAKSAERRQQAD